MIAIVGGGAMGGALLQGLASIHNPATLAVYEPNPDRAATLVQTLGIQALANLEAVAAFETVILAVKPQVLEAVAAQLTLNPKTLLISILAGASLSRLASAFKIPAIVRAMPNTPALVAAGMTALCCCPEVSPAQQAHAEAIFGSVGQVLTVPEAYMDAVTAVSGSGPGYVALILEGLIDGGVQAGLPRDLATTLAIQTVLGTATLAQKEQLHPAVLKDRVTSPGGTTIAGIAVLEAAGLRGTLMQAVQAAWSRSRSLNET